MPPRFSIISPASSRVNFSSAPVRTKVIPAKRLSTISSLQVIFSPAASSRASRSFDWGLSIHCRIYFAVMGPTSSMAVSSSSEAAASAPMVPKRAASTLAAFSPTCRMPSAKMRRHRSSSLLFAMASTAFWADFCPMRSSTSICSGRRAYRSAAVWTRPLFTSCCITAGPRPSMSMAFRLAKWVRFRSSWAGHSAPVQRSAAPSSSRTTSAPQTGQRSGSV